MTIATGRVADFDVVCASKDREDRHRGSLKTGSTAKFLYLSFLWGGCALSGSSPNHLDSRRCMIDIDTNKSSVGGQLAPIFPIHLQGVKAPEGFPGVLVLGFSTACRARNKNEVQVGCQCRPPSRVPMELCFLEVYMKRMRDAIGFSTFSFGEHEERRR